MSSSKSLTDAETSPVSMTLTMRSSILLTLPFNMLAFSVSLGGPAGEAADQGQYFAKQAYEPHPLPSFEASRQTLPAPIYEERPEWITMYWKAWELAFRNFHEPTPASGLVSQFIDAAFSGNIFLWDTCFLTMFCNYAHPLVPGIGSLDNFYAKQHADGEICREIIRLTGEDYPGWVNHEGKDLFSRWGWDIFQPGVPLPFGKNAVKRPPQPVRYRGRAVPQPPPILTLDALNHPILAWAELESHRVTGDTKRLALVYEPLVRYYGALQKYLRQGNGLYITDWASMDDSPRNPLLQHGGNGVDISSEMVLFARCLATIAEITGRNQEALAFTGEAEELARLINRHMWDPDRRFYFDLTVNGELTGIKTIAAFWTLLSGVATSDRARLLAAELENPRTFNRVHRVPTVAADEPTFDPNGYWRGGIWAPSTTMVVRGLQRYGFEDLAQEIAMNHLQNVARVFEETGTFWENYAADAIRQGTNSRKDFVGWSGLAPIMYLIENAVGLRPDAPKNELRWTLRSTKRHGCDRFRFNGHVVSLVATPAGDSSDAFDITIESNGDFDLRLERSGRTKVVRVRKGPPQQIDF